MALSEEEYLKQNMLIQGEAKFFGYQGGKIRVEPRRIEEFTPQARFLKPVNDMPQFLREKNDGTYTKYGMPLSQSAQQTQARIHGWDSMGFDDTPVIFRVNWSWMEPSDFMVNSRSEGGWRQLATVDTSPADAIDYSTGPVRSEN